MIVYLISNDDHELIKLDSNCKIKHMRLNQNVYTSIINTTCHITSNYLIAFDPVKPVIH